LIVDISDSGATPEEINKAVAEIF